MITEELDDTVKDRRSAKASSALPNLLPFVGGSFAAWSGVETEEPMLRGCDQRGLLDRLAAKGIRHLVVPLNGASEDACLFARKHLDAGAVVKAGSIALYDLERRDEGAFTRLKFLLETARSAGIMMGLSLFDAAPDLAAGPFRKGGNLQGLSLANSSTTQANEKLLASLGGVVDWVCSAARGFRGLWIEVVRNASGPVSAIEKLLSARVAETLAKHGEDLSPVRLGPWLAPRRSDNLREKHATQAAPFDSSRTISGDTSSIDLSAALCRSESISGATETEIYFQRVPRRQPVLLRFAQGSMDGARTDWLWRAFFRGYWPMVALHVQQTRDARQLETIAAISRFAVAWVGRGALRPYPELLAPMQPKASSSIFAAEDGTGRFFAHFSGPAESGLALALPTGFYRFYWIDPVSGAILDQGDGAEGGRRVGIPGCGDPTAQLLVLEQDESPDPLAVL